MGSLKKFLWASRLWVGRRQDSLLRFIAKSDEKLNSGVKALNSEAKFWKFRVYNKCVSCTVAKTSKDWAQTQW